MSLKRFNHKFQTLTHGNGKLMSSMDSETQIHGLLNESIASIRKEVVTEYAEEIPTALSNITLLFTTCKSNSVVFWKAVQMIEKLIDSIKHQPGVASRSGFMPILVDILLRTDEKIDYMLELIEELTFVIRLSPLEPYANQLLLFVVNILTDGDERNKKLQKIALSVLVNICGRNADFSSLLSQEVNLVDLHKRIQTENYGIVACKMNLVLHNCGHTLNEADIQNFLTYTTKDLSRFRSLDDKTLKHLIGFLATFAQQSYATEAIQSFDLFASLEAAILTLTTNGESSPLHINALLEVMNIFLNANNNSLKKMLVTMLNFALPFLSDNACSSHVLETINSIFNYDTKISTNSFELDDLCTTLTDMIENKNARPAVTTVALLKVLSTLAKRYANVLYDKNWLRSMLSPLFQSAAPKFSKMHAADVSLYLQCLVAMATLAECQPKDNDLAIFAEKSVQYLIGMSIKRGNAEQCKVALFLINKTTAMDSIVNIITGETGSNQYAESIEPNKTLYDGKENVMPIGSERQRKVFHAIEKACSENTLNATPASEFIDLYQHTIKILENKNVRLSHEITSERQNNVELESMSLKWSELARSLSEKNQLLASDKEKTQAILRSVRTELLDSQTKQKNSMKVLADERKRSHNLEQRVKELEEEINDAEAFQANVLKLMNKRKKST